MSSRFFSFIFLIIFSFFLYFAGRAFSDITSYLRLSEITTAELSNCYVEKKNNHTFFLMGTFVLEKEQIQIPLKGPFQNRYIVEQESNVFPPGPYSIWVEKKNHKVATFKKTLPCKALFSALLLLSILSYFLFLKRGVASSPK